MKIHDLFKTQPRLVSFEVFPPRREGNLNSLFQTLEELHALRPAYVSVTYGAGGSTRDLTVEIAVRIRKIGLTPLVHLTCVGHSRSEIRQLLETLRKEQIENLLALRGDPPQGQTSYTPPADGFRFASELVSFIRGEGFDFCVGLAGYPEGHPEAVSLDDDLDHTREKVEAGGDFIVTQLFFDNDDYFRYVARLRERGVRVPVQPGIWLLTDASQIRKIGELSKAKIPDELRSLIQRYGNDKEALVQAGIEYAARQCEDLLKRGAPGIHFYTMNKSRSALAVYSILRQKGMV